MVVLSLLIRPILWKNEEEKGCGEKGTSLMEVPVTRYLVVITDDRTELAPRMRPDAS